MKTISSLLLASFLIFGHQVQTFAKDSSPLDQAKLLVATNKTRDAIPVLEKLIASDPESAPHNYFLGMCLIKEGVRIEEAVKYVNDVRRHR